VEDIPGVDAEMVKPVRPSQLFDVLQTVLAHRVGSGPVEHATQSAVTRGQRRPRAGRSDDNAANQKVAAYGRTARLSSRRRRHKVRKR